MKNSPKGQHPKRHHPKANPRYWANRERLMGALKTEGPEASIAEFEKLQKGELPPVEARHRGSAAAYRRWNFLPPLDSETRVEKKTA
jgi:hypothetical protein